jgi:serine/threonine-protein kinase HipA
MSVQPALDASQLRRNKMKLALAVGNSRHYVVHEIMPRHFLQTATKSGIPASIVQSILDELLKAERLAVSKVMEDLPAGFPQELAQSIVRGLRSRLRLIERAEIRGSS